MTYQLVKDLLDQLNPREKELLLRRYGIEGENETLEAIANDYDLSRERIRQIQRKAEEKILALIQNNSKVENIINLAKNYLKPLGVKREEIFAKILKEKLKFDERDYKSFRFLAILHPQIIFHFQDNYFYNFYAQDEKIYTALRHSLKKIYFYFLEQNKIHSEAEVLNIVFKEIKRHIKQNVTSEDLIGFISILRHLSKNPFGFWGLYTHPYISGKNLKNKIYLILKFENEPLHFTKIYEKLNAFRELKDEFIHFNWLKNYSLDSIKNELIKHPEFVLVSRGTYALKEWGVVEGTAKELILKILKEKRRVEIKELWELISQHRQIKRSSFLIYLKQLKVKKENNWLIYDG